MATASIWSSVGVALESAAATALTVTGITKADPGVLSYTGTDPNNGDYVKLTIQGMSQLDGRVFRVANVNTGSDTFELEGEDTTNYDTFSSGTASVVTFGTTLATATGLSASGGDFDFIDVTTIHDQVRKQIPGLASPAVYTFENLWDVSDAGLVAMKTAADNQDLLSVKFTFANSQKVVFLGYIGATLLPGGNAQDKVTTQTVITMFGRPTVYAT